MLLVTAEPCQGRKLILVGLLGLGQLNLNTVDAIDAVDKQDQNEDERNLLQFEHPRAPWNCGIVDIPSCHTATLL